MWALVLLPLLLIGCAEELPAEPASDDASVGVENAFARPAPKGGTTALYLDVVNTTARPDTLRAVRAASAAQAMIHQTVENADGTTGMRAAAGVPVPAGETARLSPGGHHVMLVGLDRALAEGDSLDVEVELAQAGTLAMRVPVRFD